MWATRPGGATPWKFTSYQRDDESGLDYAMFRYDSTRLGRFMSPDLLAGNIGAPQSLNRYSYALNDPVNLVDPWGLFLCGPALCPEYYPPNGGGGAGGGGVRITYRTAELEIGKQGRATGFAKEFQKAKKLILSDECRDFLARVINAATLAAAGKSNPSELNQGELDIYNTTGEGIVHASENATPIEMRDVDLRENGFRTTARADYYAQPSPTITFYAAFYEQGTTSRAQILIHEGMHLVFPFTDPELAKAAGVPARPGESDSANFQKKLNKECK